MVKRRAAKRVGESGILPANAPRFEMVDISRINPGDNSRIFFPGLEALADLIEETKWVQTLELIQQEDGSLSIGAGERRFRACSILNARAKKNGTEIPWPALPCMVSYRNERDAFDLNVAENMGRVELRFIEVARIFQRYRDDYSLTNIQIGRACGYDERTVRTYMAIVEKCHPDIIARLEKGEHISIEFLIKIHTIQDKEIQKLRLEQWLGNPTELGAEPKNRQRASSLSRRKMVSLIKLLQAGNYQEETIQVAQFMAGMRTSLPNKLHLKLSRQSRPRPGD